MEQLNNLNFREIYKHHQNDIALLDLLKELEKKQLEFNNSGLGIADEDTRFRRMLPVSMSVMRRIRAVLKHMIINNFNIDQATDIFTNLINQNYRSMSPELIGMEHKLIKEIIENIRKEIPMSTYRKPTVADNIAELNKTQLEKIGEDYINRLTCSICMSNYVNVVLIPCGHLLCSECAIRIQNDHKQCPQCRKPIKEINDIFYQKYLKYKNKYAMLKNKILQHQA